MSLPYSASGNFSANHLFDIIIRSPHRQRLTLLLFSLYLFTLTDKALRVINNASNMPNSTPALVKSAIEAAPTSLVEPRAVESNPNEAYSKFSSRQKAIIVSIASIVGLLSPLSSNLYTPAIPTIARDLHVSTGAINLTITSYLILQGLSPTLWGAIGDSVGRRPLYIICLTVYFGSCLGLSLCNTYAGIVALRALQAVGSASTTAIGAGLIGDLVHSSRRGSFMGNYSALGGAATAFGPVLGGLFAQYTGWHGIFLFLLGLSASLLIITILFVPETMRAIVSDGSIAPPRYLRPIFTTLDAPKAQANDALRHNPIKVDFLGPLRLLLEPEVLCCIIFTGTCYTVWNMTMIATAPIYAGRYGLKEVYIGLTYISNGTGSLIGSITTGKVLNWEYRRQLARESLNSEAPVSEVRMIQRARIRPLIIPTILYLLAMVALGWVMEYQVHISASIILAFFVGGLDTCILAAFCKYLVLLDRLVILTAHPATLVVDLFQQQSFSVTACVNLSRCLIAAAGTATIQPLIQAIGVGWAFTVCASIALASCPFALAELAYGDKWRTRRLMRSANA